MIYILETKLSDNKPIFFALKNIYGVGSSKSLDICRKLGFSKNLKVKSLTEDQIKKLLKVVDTSDMLITSDLKKFKNLVLKNLVSTKSYRGLRRIKGLPVRGQRTHTNSRDRKSVV